MSMYVRVERFASASRLFRLAGLHGQLGEDARGVLVNDKPARVIFTFLSMGDRTLLQIEQSGVRRSGESLAQGSHLWIEKDLVLQRGDNTFFFFETSATSQTLASDPKVLDLFAPQLSTLIFLHVQLAKLHKRYPLVPGLIISIGSSSEDIVQFSLDGVMPQHCLVEGTANGAIIKPNNGKISCDGVIQRSSLDLKAGSAFTLEPAGLVISLG